MKRKWLPLFLILCLTLLLASLPGRTVAANSRGESSGSVVVTPVSGDTDFTTSIKNANELDGIQVVEGMVYPQGFIVKEAQFISGGIQVTGHSYGTAKVCFNFPSSAGGWKASIYQWIGKKWSKLATEVNSSGEGVPTACAEFYGNGELALIGGNSNPPQAAKLPQCIDKETGEIGKGLYGVTPFTPMLIDYDGSYPILGISFVVFTGSASEPELVAGIPVHAWIDGAGPADVISVVQASGTGPTTSVFGLTDSLIKIKILQEADYHYTLHAIVNGACQEEFTWDSAD